MKPDSVRHTVLLIAGMRGNRCRERITAALEAVPGVQRVDVNLYRAEATVAHDPACEVSELFRATLNTGYNASLPHEKNGDAGSSARGSRGGGHGTILPRSIA